MKIDPVENVLSKTSQVFREGYRDGYDQSKMLDFSYSDQERSIYNLGYRAGRRTRAEREGRDGFGRRR